MQCDWQADNSLAAIAATPSTAATAGYTAKPRSVGRFQVQVGLIKLSATR